MYTGSFIDANDLLHYGILGMKWGIRRFQPYPKGYSGTGKEIGRAKKVEEKISRKFDKIDKKIIDKQNVANKQYDRAIRKSNSLFSTKKQANKAFDKATQAQKKVNILSYKGTKYFKKYEKLIKKLDIEMNDDIKERGMKYLNDTVLNSKSAYQIALSRKI